MSQDEKTYEGQCYCGAVKIVVTGDPAGAGYCHCASCRSWSAGPVNAFTLWQPDAVKVTQGADKIGEYNKNERSYRQWCTVCGGHLLTRHPQWGLVDVYAATIPSFPFTPGVHVNYESTVLPMKDGLPKLKDFPAELGGSGEALAEYRRDAPRMGRGTALQPGADARDARRRGSIPAASIREARRLRRIQEPPTLPWITGRTSACNGHDDAPDSAARAQHRSSRVAP